MKNTQGIPMVAMIIDDDSFMLDMLSTQLSDIGIQEIICESNGEQALKRFIELPTPPSLLICDLCMPGMDGIEFLRNIAERGYQGDMILLSGMDSAVLKAAELLAKSYSVPLLGTLGKPLSSEALYAMLHKESAHVPASKVGGPMGQRPTLDELRQALINNEICIYFQPKARIDSHRIHAAECLARWVHPERGLIEPQYFIPLAEENNLIHEITLTVLRLAARQLSTWQQHGIDLKLSVNVSMDDLNQLDIPEIFSGIVNLAGITPADITLEITETRIAQDFVLSLDVLTRLRIKGFGLSIDDFGTGYSSLESLKQLPFTELKVDRAFVRNASNDAETRAILESSLKLGKSFNLNLVAEGVETLTEWKQVASLGCHEAQGYLISRPLPAADFIKAVRAWEEQYPTIEYPANININSDNDLLLVLLADDDPFVHELVQEALAQRYQVIHCNDGQEAIEKLKQHKPSLIILDVDMPNRDGLSACEEIKGTDDCADIPIMFLSGKDSIEDRMRCYEVGADDFIQKPFKLDLLEAKTARLISLNQERKQLKDSASYASSAAMTAMTSMSEIGTLLEGLKSFNHCETYPQLAEANINALGLFGLSGTVQLRPPSDCLTYSNKGPASPMDISVIEHMLKMDRIVHFKTRMAINYEHVSLLVNNMPIDDPDRCGRLRDHIAMLCEAADVRLQGITNSLRSIERGEIITRMVRRMTETLNAIDAAQRHSRAQAQMRATEIIDVVEDTLLRVALSQSQEEVLANTIRTGLEEIMQLQTDDMASQNRLSALIEEMKQVMN